MTDTNRYGRLTRQRTDRKFANKRSAVALVLLAAMMGVSACSAESPQSSESTGANSSSPSVQSETSAASGPVSSPSATLPPLHDQASDEADGNYSDGGIKWVSHKLPNGGFRNTDPKSDAGNVAENLNQFLQRVPIEWTNSPSKAYPDDTPTRKVFPVSSKYVSTSIPEYQAKKLFSAITNAVDLWRDVVIMADFRGVEFSEDGKTARVPVDTITADASPKDGMLNGLKDKSAGPDSGAILFVKEGSDWKISGISGYYGKYKCLWEC